MKRIECFMDIVSQNVTWIFTLQHTYGKNEMLLAKNLKGIISL